MEINFRKPIIFIGRLVESKGLSLLIDTYFELLKRKCENLPPLWIIGGNNFEINTTRTNESLIHQITQLETMNLIFWWGQVPHEFLPYLLRHGSIFCFTSVYEPGGRTILEAMACGLPVIASPQGLAEEVIENQQNGIIIKEREPTKWADTIERLLKDKLFAQKIGNNARKTIRKKYLMSHFYEKHWDIYKEYLNELNALIS